MTPRGNHFLRHLHHSKACPVGRRMPDEADWLVGDKTYFRASMVMIVLIFCGIFFFASNAAPSLTVTNSTTVPCDSEVVILRQQLEVAKSHMDRMNKLLTDTLAIHEADKERFNNIIKSCFAMSRRSVFCQKRIIAMQIKCKRIRADYSKVVKELEFVKNITRPG